MANPKFDIAPVEVTPSGASHIRAVDILLSKAGQEAIKKTSVIAESFIGAKTIIRYSEPTAPSH